MVVSVPRFARFPARFMAEVSTALDGPPWLSIVVMTRTTSAQPWRIAFSGGFAPARPDHPFVPPTIGTDGYAAPTVPAVVAQAKLQTAGLAAYWQFWVDDGAAPPPFGSIWMPGVMTDQYGRTRAQHGLQGQVDKVNGLVGRYVYRQDSSGGTFVFPVEKNDVLVCAPILRQVTWSGATKADAPYQDAGRTNWGPRAPPGVYRAVIQDDTASPCIDVAYEDNFVLGEIPGTLVYVAVP